MAKVSVIGAGAWGTALGMAAYRAGNQVTLWSIDADAMGVINETHQNPYLPDIAIADDIVATSNLADALDEAEILIMVVTAQVLGKVCQQIKKVGIASDTTLVICCKGIETGSLRLMSEVVQEVLPHNPLAVISGPNFADEVARGDPSATTLACEDEQHGMKLLEILGSPTFRTYYSNDIIGAQLGGAVKNVMAIACGISLGKGFGENTKVAIVTRGITELSRLCEAKGGKADTLLGLCGIGDMMLTCGTPKSRNMSLGKQLGEGVSLASILGQGKTVEGVATAQSVSQLAHKMGVDMPICEAVKQILHDDAAIDTVIKGLMSRPLAAERL